MARICMLAYAVYPADTRVRRAAECLVERGDKVDVICPHSDALGDTRKLAGVDIHPVTSFSRSGDTGRHHYVWRYLAFLLGASLKLVRLHARRRYEVIHVHTMPDFLVFAALVPRLLGARIIIDVHDLMPELYASKFKLSESHWKIRFVTALERWSISFADRAVAVHRPHLEALIHHGNPAQKFAIVMNTPKTALFKPRQSQPPPHPFRLLYHGTVARRNGLDVAVRAVALARPSIPDLELRIIGDGDYFPRIRSLVDELDLRDNVRLDHGPFPIEQLVPTIEAASVGVVPIYDDPFTRFMLPVKLLEYVAVGVPVIASATETIRAYFDKDMICLVKAGDPHELAARIIELYDDGAKRNGLAAAAACFNVQHNWDREKLTYYELIDSLTSGAVPTSGHHGRQALSYPDLEVK